MKKIISAIIFSIFISSFSFANSLKILEEKDNFTEVRIEIPKVGIKEIDLEITKNIQEKFSEFKKIKKANPTKKGKFQVNSSFSKYENKFTSVKIIYTLFYEEFMIQNEKVYFMNSENQKIAELKEIIDTKKAEEFLNNISKKLNEVSGFYLDETGNLFLVFNYEKSFETITVSQNIVKDWLLIQAGINKDKNFRVDCKIEKCIALTFDDGPSNYTNKILEILDKHNAKATFFVLGNNIERFSDTIKLASNKGHQIGTHTWDHPDLKKISLDQINSQINYTREFLLEKTGVNSKVFRPPYGSYDLNTKEYAKSPIIMRNKDTRDWESRNSQRIFAKATENLQNGDIILMHDIVKETSLALDDIITEINKKGFYLVTLDELFSGNLEDYKVYHSKFLIR